MRSERTQKGFSLLTAIFLITVLASLAVFMLATSGVSQMTPVLGLRGTQAYHAARSGLEWGIANAINTAPACPGSGTSTFANLGGFVVDVDWDCTQHQDGQPSQNVSVYVVTATASAGTAGQSNFVQRTVRAVVSPDGPL